MNKEKFNECLYIVLKEITEEKENISVDNFKYVKQYIMTNKDDEDVINFKKFLIEKLKSEMLNPNFINALYLPENLKYYRIQEIFKNLPFTNKNKNLPTYFYSLINGPSNFFGPLRNFYNACYWFFNEENQNLMTIDMMNKINEFTEQNKPLMTFFKDKYDEYNIELKRYKNILKNIYSQDYIDFIKNEKSEAEFFHQYISDIKIRENYANKKLGIIGEMCIFNIIKNLKNAIFTAKDLGNGFGYDMYFQDFVNGHDIENLIEVKTTSVLDGKDYFYLSENEYNTMLNNTNNEYANYFVCRVFAEISNKEKYTYSALTLQKDNILKSTNYDNDNIAYYYDDSCENQHCFKRKQKIYTLN